MRFVMVAILFGISLASCGETSTGDKENTAVPQEKPATIASGEYDRSHAGSAISAAVLETQDGASTTLAAFQGKPTLVNLWATWCAPCIAEMPALDRLAAARRDSLNVVAVSQDLQGWSVVTPFVDKAGLTHIVVLLDTKNAVMQAVDGASLPISILYDAKGREVWRVNGPREWDETDGFSPR